MPAVKTIPSPTDIGALANRINFETRDFHNRINAYMSIRLAIALRHGFIYRQGLAAFYHIFGAIEAEIDHLLAIEKSIATTKQLKTKKILQKFYVDEFRRKDRIYEDLTLLYYPEFQGNNDQLTAFLDSDLFTNESVELTNFVRYIHETTANEPCTILAYCHVLYLALFAGGKIMKSDVLKNVGLFPNFKHLSSSELANRGSNFYKFSEEGTADVDLRLRWEYKTNYELSTREELSEPEKQEIIKVSKDIFVLLENTIAEIGQRNKSELMGTFSFKVVTYLVEEWKYNEKISGSTKQLIILTLLTFQLLLVYFLLRKFI